jgi:hypothetical protein
MFVRSRANSIMMKGLLVSEALDILFSCALAKVITEDGSSVLVNVCIVLLMINAAHLVLSLQAVIHKGLYNWFFGRKYAVTALRATFAHYQFPKRDLLEESVETWMQRVVDRSDLDVAAKAGALICSCRHALP